MSKSKHNGVDPAAVIDRYGADTARMFILFKAPPEKDLDWDDADVEGQFRFLQRLWRLVDAQVKHVAVSPATGESDSDIRRAVHQAIKAVSEDLSDDFQFNTAISELMKLSNALSSGLAQASAGVRQEAMSALVRLLAPFAPHLAEEFWQQLGGEESVHLQPWPDHDPAALVLESIEVVIQVKGKVRGSMSVAVDCSKEELERLALASDVAQRWLEGKPPRRVIVVPGKLVNLVPSS
jgi:leucyl-tRNA synthetase